MGGRLGCRERLGAASQPGRCETAALPPVKSSRAKCRRVCTEMTNTTIAGGSSPALFLSQAHRVPIRMHLSSTGCNLWLQRPGSAHSPSLLLQQLGCARALWGPVLLAATLWLLPGSQPSWPKVPALPQKAKAALCKCRPPSPRGTEACSGGQNPNK